MIKKSLFITTIIAIFITSVHAQKNLVPNGSFDEVDKKIKAGGQIDMATGWSSPHDLKADLYSKDAKIEDFMAPENTNGKEEPWDGNGFAGIYTYAYKNASPNSFLQAQLIKPLVAGKTYCVKYLISLADLSKYATDNVGLYLSNEKPLPNDIDKGEIKPQIVHSQNKVIEETYTWVPICRTYAAQGGEQHITIGNFAKFEETKAIKVKRPSGFSKPQKNVGYYYIESVSVIPMDSLREDECICEKENGVKKMNVVYNQNISTEHRLEDKHVVEFTQVHFESGGSGLQDDAKASLDKIAEILIAEADFMIEIQGHTDEVEAGKHPETLSDERANAAKKYLADKGIATDRMTAVGFKNSQLNNTEGTPAGQAKNRRVQFKVIE